MKKLFNILKKIGKSIFLCMVPILIFLLITSGFAFFDAGLAWENLDSNFIWSSYLTLISYRLSIYLVPGFLLFVFGKNKNKASLINSFENQFISYALLKLVWEFFAVDFILSTTIFDQMDSAIILIGLLLSLVLNKKVKLETGL